ncbi:MAG: hypothetical protein JST17_02665 [Bacteroidetes bacterium]|nr:hypothetical protein [Bacteroidota bacterium]MBS1931210.1 hypothetical protein [Bacteroidota bacterium]
MKKLTTLQLKALQPKLVPIEKKYEDYCRKRNEAAKKAVAEILKRPYSYEQAVKNLDKLRTEGLKIA